MSVSVEALADNCRRHVEAIANEIADRVIKEIPQYVAGRDLRECIKRHVIAVELDWLLGDWMPLQKP